MAKRRSAPEINASSMADIAFLLLIFFLVTTTMDIDKGLTALLPPISDEEPEESSIVKRNVLEILVNSRDMLLVEGEPIEVSELREITKKHVDNNGVLPEYSVSPDKAVVSLKNDKGTSYGVYVGIQNELKAAYNELRDKFSVARFGVTYEKLDGPRKREIRAKYPLKISEAEPEDVDQLGKK